MIYNKLFSNYKCTSKQREAVNWQLIFVSMFMLFERLVEIKIWNLKSSLLYWCTTLLLNTRLSSTNVQNWRLPYLFFYQSNLCQQCRLFFALVMVWKRCSIDAVPKICNMSRFPIQCKTSNIYFKNDCAKF